MFDENILLETKLSTPYDAENGYVVEMDLKYSNKLKQKNKLVTMLSRA